jgi:putative oxidoreductase
MSALCDFAKRYFPLAGRVLMSLIFFISAFGKIAGFTATAAGIAARGMPVSEALLVCAIVLELVGATLLVLGWKTEWSALALIVFMVPATLLFHDYWRYPPEQAHNQRNHFLKNVAMTGGLLFVMGMGAGPLSVDARRRRERGAPNGG